MIQVPTILLVLVVVFGFWLPIGLFLKDLFGDWLVKRLTARFDVNRLHLMTRAELESEESIAALRKSLAKAGVEASVVERAVKAAGKWALTGVDTAAANEQVHRITRDAEESH